MNGNFQVTTSLILVVVQIILQLTKKVTLLEITLKLHL